MQKVFCTQRTEGPLRVFCTIPFCANASRLCSFDTKKALHPLLTAFGRLPICTPSPKFFWFVVLEPSASPLAQDSACFQEMHIRRSHPDLPRTLFHRHPMHNLSGQHAILKLPSVLMLFGSQAPSNIMTNHHKKAQQRYFSYRAILVAIVSQFFVCFMEYRATIARYIAKWGIAQMWLCETK